MLHKGNYHDLPSKNTLVPTKQVFYSNTPSSSTYRHHELQNYMDYTNTPKYADLFINPPFNPHMYSFDEAPVPAYPLDTVIPNYPTPQKMPSSQQQDTFVPMAKKSPSSELENLLTTTTSMSKAVSPATELENMIKFSTDTDLASLFSVFGPTNNDHSDTGAGDFAIPSTSAMGIFDSFPADFFQDSPSPPGQQQQSTDTMWRSGEQNFTNMVDNNLPLSTNDSDSSSFWIPSSSSQLTPLLEAFPSLDNDLPLPTPSSLSLSPPTHTPNISRSQSTNSLANHVSPNTENERGALSFHEQLEFFEGTLDWDSILPPTKRLQELPPSHSEASSPVSHMHISPAPTPLPPSSPPSPIETKPDIKSIISPPFLDLPATEKLSKSSPLLFGKTEDEILLKVLVHRSGPNSKPVTREKLILMPVEDFNRLLDVSELNEIEVAFMKEWRRRGKNKTAAMVARKRKRDELTDLDIEVEQLRKQKAGLKLKFDRLRSDISTLKERTRLAEDRVYQRYTRQSGIPVSRDSHVIHVDKAGKVLLGPRTTSQQLLLVK